MPLWGKVAVFGSLLAGGVGTYLLLAIRCSPLRSRDDQ